MGSLGSRIKKARNNKGYTQEELALKLEVDRSTVASWETGRRDPDTSTLFKIAKLCEVPIGWLFGDLDIKKIDLVDLLENEKTQITAGGRPLTPEERIKILEIVNLSDTDATISKKKVIDINDIKLSAANKDGEEVRVEPSPELKAILEEVMNEVLEKRERKKKH